MSERTCNDCGGDVDIRGWSIGGLRLCWTCLCNRVAIVEKLPVLGGGTRAVPGMTVWAAFRDGVFRGTVTGVFKERHRVAVTFDESVQICDDEQVRKLRPLASCLYSTQAAAEAAKE